ncbi:proto-oncogene serine/threonine-protein kinase mos-like [Arctopsyche grandis]|uniref:proto-oncogene serine/threonine-protein kinase mos-like n=1 Tax=Arctopsyche grandis TaxID=121162 RepID=UPI00406D7871
MSTVKLYRKFVATPLSNSSPGLVYFTPTKLPSSKNSSNFLKLIEPHFYPKTSSAEWFKKREKKLQKFQYYQKSPCLPKYLRYQSIKKRLIFTDSPNKTKCKDHHNLDLNKIIIPSITLTSPSSRESSTVLNFQHDNNCIQIHTPNVERIASPNIQNLIKKLSTHSQSIKFTYQVLGRGRFGSVIKTKYKGKIVAAKVIYNYRKKMKPMLLSEQNGIGLNHKNIVKVHSIAWSNNLSTIIMDCYDTARNLQSLLDSDAFEITINELFRYPFDICNALDYLHSKKILHLDVKPKNILTFANNTCKLCDFGTSIKYDENFSDVSSVLMLQGTTRYCAPEILKGKYPTVKSDVYSLGITMWQIIHRATPYGYGIREESLIYQIVKNGLRPRINKSLSSCPTLKNFKNIYVNCWNANSEERCDVKMIKKQLQYIANCKGIICH